MATLNYR